MASHHGQHKMWSHTYILWAPKCDSILTTFLDHFSSQPLPPPHVLSSPFTPLLCAWNIFHQAFAWLTHSFHFDLYTNATSSEGTSLRSISKIATPHLTYSSWVHFLLPQSHHILPYMHLLIACLPLLAFKVHNSRDLVLFTLVSLRPRTGSDTQYALTI